MLKFCMYYYETGVERLEHFFLVCCRLCKTFGVSTSRHDFVRCFSAQKMAQDASLFTGDKRVMTRYDHSKQHCSTCFMALNCTWDKLSLLMETCMHGQEPDWRFWMLQLEAPNRGNEQDYGGVKCACSRVSCAKICYAFFVNGRDWSA